MTEIHIHELPNYLNKPILMQDDYYQNKIQQVKLTSISGLIVRGYNHTKSSFFEIYDCSTTKFYEKK